MNETTRRLALKRTSPYIPPMRVLLHTHAAAGARTGVGHYTAELLAAYFKEQGADTTVFWHEGGHEIRREELLAVRDWLQG